MTYAPKKFFSIDYVLKDISVSDGYNCVILSADNEEVPDYKICTDNNKNNGVIVASLTEDVGGVGYHSLNVVAGSTSLNPKNLVVIRDSTYAEKIYSNSKEIFGLFQVEFGAINGDFFNDINHRAQISFVIEGSQGTFVACPVIDIQGKTIRYSYNKRSDIVSLNEQSFITSVALSSSVFIGEDPVISNIILVDEIGSLTYIGEAKAGTLTSQSLWKIFILDESGTSGAELLKLWASGTSSYDKEWDEKENYTYS